MTRPWSPRAAPSSCRAREEGKRAGPGESTDASAGGGGFTRRVAGAGTAGGARRRGRWSPSSDATGERKGKGRTDGQVAD
jgi:hypothetical protein